ncbi:MAG: hotdog fold thioesterase [Gammaproteobacteria bacterium]|nr:hotdog fold thioesterase [Gammaproteobacteria bacterium]
MELPQDEKIIAKSFEESSKGTAVENLGITIEAVDSEQIVLKMPITDKARQPYGLLHGGISMVLAETAASFHACWGIDLAKVYPVGIEINGSHVRSATEGMVRAKGTVIRRTRSIIVHQVDIILEETGQLLSTARVTNFYKKVEKEEG